MTKVVNHLCSGITRLPQSLADLRRWSREGQKSIFTLNELRRAEP